MTLQVKGTYLHKNFILTGLVCEKIRVATAIEKLNSRTFQNSFRFFFQDCLSSGVARVSCALGQEIFLRPL